MKLSDITSETRPITVAFESGDLKVVYRPNVFTAAMADEINAAMADPKQANQGMFQMATTVIAEWDLEDDKAGKGKMFPLTDHDRLHKEIPIQVFGRIFEAIRQDQDPGKADARS